MEYRQLKCFAQLCIDLNFSKAARKLFITQQALSKTIKNLEHELGVQLFHRSHTGLVLTEFGKYLEGKTEHLLLEIGNVEKDIQALRNNQYGEVKIAFAFGVMSALSPDLLSDFMALYPNITLHIGEYPDDECEQIVASEKAHVGFSIAPIDHSQFNARVVKKDRMCLMVNTANPLSRKKEIRFAELRDQQFIIVNERFKFHHNFVNRCRQAGFEPNIYHSTMEMILVHKLSRANKGIGVSVHFITDNTANIRAIPFADPSCTWDACLITKKKAHIGPFTSAFIDYILNIHDASINY